mmetsp:Transcript_10337/g.14592  ORF Transcript_10337/g.14592 Transcript_10337/m.14592 type:complete len:96 (+) Transcript_10337:159-446(+)
MKKNTKVNANRVPVPRPYSTTSQISLSALGSFHQNGCRPRRTPEERRRHLQRVLQDALDLVDRDADFPSTANVPRSEETKETRDNAPPQGPRPKQ